MVKNKKTLYAITLNYYALLIVLIVFASCASIGNLQDAWDRATPDERARLVLSLLQDELHDLVLIAKRHRAVGGPEYEMAYQARIKPALSRANKMLRELMIRGKRGALPTLYVKMQVEPLLHDIRKLLDIWSLIEGGA